MTSFSSLHRSPRLASPAGPSSAAAESTTPAHIIAQVETQLGPRLRPALRTELRSLATETDRGLFLEGLLNLGVRQEQTDQLEIAGALYSTVAAAGGPEASRAQARLDAILGRGAAGARAEFLLRRLAREAASPSMLVGMAGAQVVFGLTRVALLSRLAASPTASFLTRGFGARTAASLGAFALEAPSFVAFTRGANAALGVEQDWSLATLGREVAGSYITLGALKSMGALSTSAFNRIHGINPLTGQATRLTGLSAVSQRLLPQAAMFGGIVAGHELETRVGLRDRVDGATTMVDSLAMLLQFHVGGRLMGHALPHVEALNREFNIRSEELGRLPVSHDGSSTSHPALIPGLAVATGVGAPETLGPRDTLQGLIPDRLLMTAQDPTGGSAPETSGPREGTPVPGSGPRSVPPGKGGGAVGSAIRRVQALGGKFNLNVALDPDSPLHALPTERPASPVRSVREGIRRAETLGQDRRTLAFLRWGAHQLRGDAEVQGQFLNLMLQVFEFQRGQREALDPILRDLPAMDFREVNQLGEKYAEALATLTPNSGRHFAEARLLLERTREWNDEATIRGLSDAQLREVGLEPSTRHAVARNAHAFTRTELLRVLDHPLLRGLPETTKVREATERFHEELNEVRGNLEGVKRDVKRMRAEIAATEDVAQRRDLETQIRERSQGINITYTKAMLRFNKAMERFMADDFRSRVFLIENARRSSLVRGLQDAEGALLIGHVRAGLDRLDPAARESAEAFLAAAEQQAIVSERSGLRRSFYSALRVFGLDPLPPLEVRARYENSLLQLIQRADSGFWEFAPLEAEPMARATEAQSGYYRTVHETTARLREGFAAVEKANDAHWERYDREAVPLYTADLRLQVRQLDGELERFLPHLSRNVKLRIPEGTSEHEVERMRFSAGDRWFADHYSERYAQLKTAAEEAIANFENPSTRGANSRDGNRSLEVSLRKVAELRAFLRQTMRRERYAGAEFRAVSALMLPFVDKIDRSGRDGWRESLGAGWPVLWRTFFRSMGLFSSLERNESTSVLDRHFLNWASGLTRSSESRFVVDPNVDHLVEAEPVVAAGNHNSWLDFLLGGTPAARAAQLQGRGSSRDAMRIGAKEGLGKMIGPVIERAIDMLTEPVADSAPEYDGSVTNLARAMAFGDQPSGRLGPRSAAVYDELTMSVASLVNPYAFDPFPAVSSFLNPPQGGRSFNIADRAAALTGRTQNLLITSTLNAYRLWPKPDRPLPLRRGPTVTATQFVPASALMDFAAEGRNGGGTRANWLRTLWLNLAAMPEYQRGVPSIERMFQPFEEMGDLNVEAALARRFAGRPEIYSEAAQRDLRFVQGAMDPAARRALGTRLRDIRDCLGQIPKRSLEAPVAAGVRRLERVVAARIGLLESVERKLQRGEELSRTERNFVARMQGVFSEEAVPERDRLLEQADYFLRLRNEGVSLKDNLIQVQNAYYEFVRNWNERRRNPENPEYAQIHVSEAPGYEAVWQNYRRAIETTLNLYGVTPKRWEGQIVPDVEFVRDGDSMVVQPRGWRAGREFSRGSLWRFLLDDTTGIVRVAKRLREFDSTPDLYLTLHGRGWGWRMMDRTNTRIRIENTENFREVANGAMVVAPTHDSGAEFMTVPAVMHDYGIRAFFMADRKFFDPFPKPPAFGAIKALLGPMDQYGHLAIDRSDRRAAMQVMNHAGRFMRDTGRSVIIFPGGTRNPVRYDENGERYEGPIYGNRPGVAMTMEESRLPILPLGLVNGGVIFPKQNGDAFLRRGAALGREYQFHVGVPLRYETIIPGNPTPKGPPLRSAVTQNLDRQFAALTGREMGPPAESKAKKGR